MFIEQKERDDCMHFVDEILCFHVARQSDEFARKHLKSLINIAGFIESKHLSCVAIADLCSSSKSLTL